MGSATTFTIVNLLIELTFIPHIPYDHPPAGQSADTCISGTPIHPGDLLTTSDMPGYAMKATDPKIGTILGKAMGTLESGTGVIEVLVTLQ
jgi:hypothetical protein